jgi:hypothetical protein
LPRDRNLRSSPLDLETGRNDNPTLGTLDRDALPLDTGVTLGIEDIEPES